MKPWAETTYRDPIPSSLVVNVNRRTAPTRFAKCRYLLRRGGGIWHEWGGRVISEKSLGIIDEMLRQGTLRDDGPDPQTPDATLFTFVGQR